MAAASDEVRGFFATFERAGATGDVGTIGDLFDDPFLSADPHGAQPVSRSALRAALPMREKLFASIGASAARLVSLAETRLDDTYVLVNTEWEMDVTPPGDALALASTFILRRAGDALRVVFYLNHHDIAQVVQARATSGHAPMANPTSQ